MKFLLATLNSKYIHSNLAVCSLKAWAESMSETGEEDDIQIAEHTISQPADKIMADIFSRKADVLFLSCYIWNISMVSSLAEDMSKVRPELDIWLGGPEVSFHQQQTLEKMPFIRGILTGEGERSFGNLITAYSRTHDDGIVDRELFFDMLRNIDGIAYRDGSGCVMINAAKEPMDLSEIPFPYKDLQNFSNRIIYYESSRGCPFRCSYCLSSIDKKLRLRNTEKVKQELKFFIDAHVPQVKFTDRTFNSDHRHAMDIWQFIKENDNGETNFHFEIAADLLTDEELGFLGTLRPGQVQLEAGIQSTNHETLNAINRTMDIGRVRNAVEKIRTAGNIHIHLDLIAGLPFESFESFETSFNDVFDMRPEQLQLGFLKVLKGTPVEDRCREYGIIYRSEPPYEVLATKWITYEELVELKGIEEMVEVYYNSGQFRNSVEEILKLYISPFSFFRELAGWYEKCGLDMVNISRNSRYEIFIDFASELFAAHEADFNAFMENLICDYYMRDNVKNRPAFFGENGADKKFTAEFYRKESEEREYLKSEAYDGADIRFLRRTTHIEKLSGKYWLFDYSDRDPLYNNARMIEIDSKRYEKYNG